MHLSCSGRLWGFVVAFMLFNVKGSNLYFWIAIIPITVSWLSNFVINACIIFYRSRTLKRSLFNDPMQLLFTMGAKLQHVIATLTLENADIVSEEKLRPRDELFWFNKPELLLRVIHFILFQVLVFSSQFLNMPSVTDVSYRSSSSAECIWACFVLLVLGTCASIHQFFSANEVDYSSINSNLLWCFFLVAIRIQLLLHQQSFSGVLTVDNRVRIDLFVPIVID